MGARRVRFRRIRLSPWLLGTSALFAWITVFNPGHIPWYPGQRRLYAITALVPFIFGAFVAVREWRWAVVFNDDSVSIPRMFHNRRLKSSDIERFDVVPAPFSWQGVRFNYVVVAALLRSGRRVRIMNQNIFTSRRRLADLCNRLNHELGTTSG